MMEPVFKIANPQARLSELRYQLDQLDAPAARALGLRGLADPYPPVRHAAAQALSQRMTGALAETLRALLTGAPQPGAPPPQLEVTRAACVALRGAPGEATWEALRRCLESPDSDTRYQALTSLFHLDTPDERWDALMPALLSDPDDEVASVAAQVCAARGLASQRDALARRRASASAATRLHFTLALIELPGALDAPTQGALADELIAALAHEQTSAAASQALTRLGERAAPALRASIIEALQRPLKRWLLHPILKVEAAGALAALGDPQGLAFLRGQLASRRKDARGYALTVAGRARLMPLFEEVAHAARHDAYHGETAILALGAYGTPQASALLEELWRVHPDAECRALAQQALKRDGAI